jgi:hypothetical protein
MARRFGVSRKVITSDGVAVPTLSNSESTPPGTTIYVKLDLQIKETPPEVGIFIPDGFELGSHIDLLLYMRGFKIADEVVSVESYFKQSYGKLREGVNSSGRNVILVAPALGPTSQAGTLVKPGGLDSFLRQALAAVLKHGGLATPPKLLTLGHLIIACHSGGGAPVRKRLVRSPRRDVSKHPGPVSGLGGRNREIRPGLHHSPAWVVPARQSGQLPDHAEGRALQGSLPDRRRS